MVRVSLTALFALSILAEHASAETHPDLDRRCYRLMAALAEEDDPQVRSAGMIGAQYFLGRLDVDAPVAIGDEAPIEAAEREQLVRRCAALMGAGDRDFRALGERLARAAGPV